MSQSSQQAFKNRSVQETAKEAKTVADDIRFIMENSGADVKEEIGFDDESIITVEQFYRSSLQPSVSQQPPASLFIVEDFERLLSLYLGQVLVERAGGEWVQYQGKYHVVNPFCVKLPSQKFVDVFLFCTNLHQKQVDGSRNNQALLRFIENVDKFVIP
ncbi:hypothetical protein [Gimesia panareensis]|nr:hypothetical protein [Gimesia panareensis]